MKKTVIMLSVLTILAMGLSPIRARAQTYIAASDFSLSSNPGGVWSYGQQVSLGGTFTLFTVQLDLSPVTDPNSLLGWGASSGFPFVVLNTSGTSVTAGTTVYPAGTVAMHPDDSGNLSVLRWTAPSTGSFAVNVTFFDIPNADPATVDVHVFHNTMSLFNDNLYNTVTTTSYASGTLALTMGDTIDFIVGNGSNTYVNDHTAITAQIMAVPEPSTLALLALGGGLLFRRVRRAPAGRA